MYASQPTISNVHASISVHTWFVKYFCLGKKRNPRKKKYFFHLNESRRRLKVTRWPSIKCRSYSLSAGRYWTDMKIPLRCIQARAGKIGGVQHRTTLKQCTQWMHFMNKNALTCTSIEVYTLADSFGNYNWAMQTNQQRITIDFCLWHSNTQTKMCVRYIERGKRGFCNGNKPKPIKGRQNRWFFLLFSLHFIESRWIVGNALCAWI